MKYLVYLAITITVFSACNSGNGSFTVSGKITKAPSNTVYLEELSYDSPNMKVLDSAKINADGTYKLKGSSQQQNLFVVGFKDNPVVILVNDASNIKIDFDVAGFNYPDVSGSDATKELYQFIKDYWKKDSVLSTTYYKLDTMNKANLVDTNVINNLQQQYTQQLSALSDVLTGFVNRSKNPAAICFVLDKAKGILSPEALQSMVDNAARRFPNHTGISTFKADIAKQQKTEQDPYANYPLLNQQAPNLTMQSIDGKTMHISDFKGKYLLVDFWASWCSPCRQENPNVVAAYNKFKDKNFTILGVSLDEDKQSWVDAVKKDGLTWNQMSDLKHWESAAVAAYQIEGIPFNVLLDPSGKVIAVSLRGPALEQKLAEVLQ